MRMSFLVIYDLCIQSFDYWRFWWPHRHLPKKKWQNKKRTPKHHQLSANHDFSFDSWGDQLDLFGSLEARGLQSCRTYCTRGVEHVPGGGMDGCKWMIRDELNMWVNLVNVTELCKLDWDGLREFLIVFVDGEFKWLFLPLHLGYFWSLPAKLHEQQRLNIRMQIIEQGKLWQNSWWGLYGFRASISCWVAEVISRNDLKHYEDVFFLHKSTWDFYRIAMFHAVCFPWMLSAAIVVVHSYKHVESGSLQVDIIQLYPLL